MNNNEFYNKRQEAIKEATGIYNQIVQDQTNLINNQGKEIDSYLQNTNNNINQSINQNIGELNNASENAKRQHEAEKQAIMNNYNNYTANNIDESIRIGALNSARNRINTSAGSLNDVVQEYNNQIAQAKITGQSMIAQNALEILKEKLNLYSTSMDNINNNLMSYRDNVANLVQQYGDLDAQYSGVRNDYLDRQEDFRQFNKEMAYNTQQLNTKKNLMEQQYQLDLQDAKEAYYDRLYSASRSSSRGGSSSGGYTISDSGSTSSSSKTTSSSQKAPNYKIVATPGLIATGKASANMKKVFKSLQGTVAKHGYVTDNWLNHKLSGLSSNEANNLRAVFRAI